jgi:hypothetical protein
MTNIVDKYSGSSSDLLLINSRMGAGVSKDTLKRYINNKCIQLNEHDDIHGSFSLLTICDDTDLSEDFTNFEPGADTFFASELIMATNSKLAKNCIIW